MKSLFAIAFSAVVAVGCSESVAPTTPRDGLEAKGGVKGPNRLHFVMDFDPELDREVTMCHEEYPDCVWSVAGLKKPDVLTITMTSNVYSAWDCMPLPEDGQDDDGPSAFRTYSRTIGPFSGSKSYAGSIGLWREVEAAMTCPDGTEASLWNIDAHGHTLTAIAGRDTVTITGAMIPIGIGFSRSGL
ncbi:hypothetical protein BH23GEM2_BH23GEM2_14820 [soil metagenome]